MSVERCRTELTQTGAWQSATDPIHANKSVVEAPWFSNVLKEHGHGQQRAFAAMFLEALGDAGVKYGLQRATAYRLAAKMIEGVGALCLDSGVHPGAMKDAVCSPGGTTIKGVAELENRAFRGAVISAVDAIEQG